jgi:hypothetical protein
LVDTGLVQSSYWSRGLIKGHAQNEDVFIGEAMTSKMFMDQETGIGLDLAAQIIQQERPPASTGTNVIGVDTYTTSWQLLHRSLFNILIVAA